jgi:hypothetical protein
MSRSALVRLVKGRRFQPLGNCQRRIYVRELVSVRILLHWPIDSLFVRGATSAHGKCFFTLQCGSIAIQSGLAVSSV